MELLEIFFDQTYYVESLKQGLINVEISEEELSDSNFNAWNHYKNFALDECFAPNKFLLERPELIKSEIEDEIKCQLATWFSSELATHEQILKDYICYLVKIDLSRFKKVIQNISNTHPTYLENFLGMVPIIDAYVAKKFFILKNHVVHEDTIVFFENVIDNPNEDYNKEILTMGKRFIWTILINYSARFAKSEFHAIFLSEKMLGEQELWYDISRQFVSALTKNEKYFAEEVFNNFEELIEKDASNIDAISFITHAAAAGLYNPSYNSLLWFRKFLKKKPHKAAEAIFVTLESFIDGKHVELDLISENIKYVLDYEYPVETKDKPQIPSSLLGKLISLYTEKSDELDSRAQYKFTEIFASILDTPTNFKTNLEELAPALLLTLDNLPQNQDNEIIKNIILIISRLHSRYVQLPADTLSHFLRYLDAEDFKIHRLAADLMNHLTHKDTGYTILGETPGVFSDGIPDNLNQNYTSFNYSREETAELMQAKLSELQIDLEESTLISSRLIHLIDLDWPVSFASDVLDSILGLISSKISEKNYIIDQFKKALQRIYEYSISDMPENEKYGISYNMIDRDGSNITDIFNEQSPEKWDVSIKKLFDHNQFFVVKDLDTLFEELKADNAGNESILNLEGYLREKFQEIKKLDEIHRLRYEIKLSYDKEPIALEHNTLYVYTKGDKVFYKALSDTGRVIKEIKPGDVKRQASSSFYQSFTSFFTEEPTITEEDLQSLQLTLLAQKPIAQKDIDNIYGVSGYYKSWTRDDFISWKEKIQKHGVTDDNLAEIISVLIYAAHLHEEFFVRDSQILSLLLLHKSENGRLAQIATGEGKTNIITMFACLKVLNNEQVDIVTSARKLAERDFKEQRPIYNEFGITVGFNGDRADNNGYKKCYESDVVYGYTIAFMADALKDTTTNVKGGRGYGNIIVDEVDNLFIDQLSMKVQRSSPIPGFEYLSLILIHMLWLYLHTSNERILDIAVTLQERVEDPEALLDRVMLSEEDLVLIQKLVKETMAEIITEQDNTGKKILDMPSYLKKFVHSHLDAWAGSIETGIFRYEEKIHYKIHPNPRTQGMDNIAPLDYTNTGSIQTSLRWSDGLHQVLQIIHGLSLEQESLINIYTSYIGYFLKYKGHIYGVTGTVGTKDHIQFLHELYGTDSVKIPNFIHKRLGFLPPVLAENKDVWVTRILENTSSKLVNGRAILIICRSIKDLELISNELKNENYSGLGTIFEYGNSDDQTAVRGILHPGDVIVATNLAGRGADIKIHRLVEEAGGLHVIFTYYPGSIRVEKQAFGRGGRKAERGSGQLIINRGEITICGPRDLVTCLEQDREGREERELAHAGICHKPYFQLKDDLFKKSVEIQRAILSPTGYKIVKAFAEDKTGFFQGIITEVTYATEEDKIYVFLDAYKVKIQVLGQGCYYTLDITDDLKNLDIRSYNHIVSAISDKERGDDFSYRDLDLIHFLAALNGYDNKQDIMGRVVIAYEYLWRKGNLMSNPIIDINLISNLPAEEETYLKKLVATNTENDEAQITIRQLNQTRQKKLFELWQEDRKAYNKEWELKQMRDEFSMWLKAHASLLTAGDECDVYEEKTLNKKKEISRAYQTKEKDALREFAKFEQEMLKKENENILFNNPAYLSRKAFNYQAIDAKQRRFQKDLRRSGFIETVIEDGNSYEVFHFASTYKFNEESPYSTSQASMCKIKAWKDQVKQFFLGGQVPVSVYVDDPLNQGIEFLKQANSLNEVHAWSPHNALAAFWVYQRGAKIRYKDQAQEAAYLKRDFCQESIKAYKVITEFIIPELQASLSILQISGIVGKDSDIIMQHHLSMKAYQLHANHIKANIEKVQRSADDQTIRINSRARPKIEDLKLYQADIDCYEQLNNPDCYSEEKPAFNQTTEEDQRAANQTIFGSNQGTSNMGPDTESRTKFNAEPDIDTKEAFSFNENLNKHKMQVADIEQFPMVIERIYGEGGYLYGVDLVTLKSDEDWTTVVFAIALAAIQIGIGIALASSGAGVFATTFGKSLIFQGIGDVISTVELLSHGHSVDMDNFMKSKGVSIAIALITASIAHIGNKLAPNMKAFQGNNPFVDSKGNSISVSEYLIKQTAIAGGMHLLGKEISKVGETLLKDSSVQDAVEDAVAEVINDHLEDLKIIFGSDDWQAYLKKLLAEEQNIIKSHTNKYHNDGVTIAKRVAGNVASMFAGNFNFVGAAVAGSMINVGAGIAEVTAINNVFIHKFGNILNDLANSLQGSEITITDEELRSRIEAFRTNLQSDIFEHMSNTIQNDIINPVANVLGTSLMNILIDKLYQKAPKQKQTGPAKKAKQNVYEEAPLDEEFVVLKDIVLEDDFVTASDEAEFPPFKKAEKFKYAPDQKSIDEIVKLFHQNKAPSANYDGECANADAKIFNLQDYFHSHEYDPKQLGTLSAVTGRPVHLYKDGIKIGEANNAHFSVMRPIEINYNTDTRMYHSMGDGMSFYGHETILDVALQDQAIFASYGTQTNLQDAMNSFQNTYPFSFTDKLSYEEFLQTLRERAQPTRKIEYITHSDYTEALYDLYLNGRPLEDIHVNELEAYTHIWAKKIQTIKEFSKGNLPMTTSVVNALFKTAEKVMDSVGVLVKELLINPTENYLEATDPKTNAEIKKYLKDITGEIKYWFDGLTPAVQEIIKDGFKVADVAGTAGLVKGAIQGAKAGIVAETKAAATPTLLSKTKLLRAVEDLKNRLDNIVPPFEFATAEGISLSKIPKNTCPNPKIKNSNTLFNMGEGIDTKIKTNVGTTLSDITDVSHSKANPIWTEKPTHSSVKNAYSHWKDHASEFSEIVNAKQYVEAAKKFLNNPPKGTLTKTRANGDIIRYHPGSNIFAVMDKTGKPRTMFKPDPSQHGYKTNLEYFYGQ